MPLAKALLGALLTACAGQPAVPAAAPLNTTHATAAVHSDTTSTTAAVPSSTGDAQSSLTLWAKVVESAGEEGQSLALEVTLRNGRRSEWVWLDGFMAAFPGPLQIDVQTENGTRIESSCSECGAPSGPWHYLMLLPGDAITRTITLGCYRFPRGAVRASVTYHNTDPAPAPSPLPNVALFRGPLLSNPVSFQAGGDAPGQ